MLEKDFERIEITGKYPLLEKLLSVFRTEGELNPILAGYVSKVFCTLIDKYKLRLWKYFQTYQENLEALLKKADDQSVITMITRLMETIYGDSNDPEFINQKQSLIKKLIEDIDENTIEGRYNLLISFINGKVEITYFMSEEIVNLLYQLVEKNTTFGLKLIKALMEAYNSEKSKPIQESEISRLLNNTT